MKEKGVTLDKFLAEPQSKPEPEPEPKPEPEPEVTVKETEEGNIVATVKVKAPTEMAHRIDDPIYVRPTEEGLRILQARHDEFLGHLPSSARGAYERDVRLHRACPLEGYIKYTLRELMEHIGVFVAGGGALPFDLEIQIPAAAE